MLSPKSTHRLFRMGILFAILDTAFITPRASRRRMSSSCIQLSAITVFHRLSFSNAAGTSGKSGSAVHRSASNISSTSCAVVAALPVARDTAPVAQSNV